MKQTISILSLAGLLALAGCSGGASSSSSTNADKPAGGGASTTAAAPAQGGGDGSAYALLKEAKAKVPSDALQKVTAVTYYAYPKNKKGGQTVTISAVQGGSERTYMYAYSNGKGTDLGDTSGAGETPLSGAQPWDNLKLEEAAKRFDAYAPTCGDDLGAALTVFSDREKRLNVRLHCLNSAGNDKKMITTIDGKELPKVDPGSPASVSSYVREMGKMLGLTDITWLEYNPRSNSTLEFQLAFPAGEKNVNGGACGYVTVTQYKVSPCTSPEVQDPKPFPIAKVMDKTALTKLFDSTKLVETKGDIVGGAAKGEWVWTYESGIDNDDKGTYDITGAKKK